MGRELKRVPMSFDWPLTKTWKGYINPYYKIAQKCTDCDGSGYSPDGKFLNDSWYAHNAQNMFGAWFGCVIEGVPSSHQIRHMGWGQEVVSNIERARRFGFKILAHWSDKLEQEEVDALVSDGRLHDLTHDWNGKKWIPKDPMPKVTPADVAAWSTRSFGHDGINQCICVRARAQKYGVELTCATCKGEGEIWPDEATKKACEEWECEEPPVGPGYQLWETTSEGSPISPVFATLRELAQWAEKNATTFASEKATAEQWEKMLGHGFVCHTEGNITFM